MTTTGTEVIYVYDAVAVGTIPASAQVILVYIDGDAPTLETARAQFPHATLITVTTGSTPGARICDCENGDDQPAAAAAWALGEIEAKRFPKPTIYSQSAWYGNIRQACANVGLTLGVDVDYFGAWWNGQAIIYPGWVGHQYLRVSEFTYDISVAYAGWIWPVLPTTAPKEPAMIIQAADGNLYRELTISGNTVLMALSELGTKAVQTNKWPVFVDPTDSLFNMTTVFPYEGKQAAGPLATPNS